MENTTRKIKNFGEIDIDKTQVTSQQVELHVSITPEGKAEKILEDCISQYKEKYPETDEENDIYWDFNVTLSSKNYGTPRIEACVYIWQVSDEELHKDTAECYDEINFHLDDQELKEFKKAIAPAVTRYLETE